MNENGSEGNAMVAAMAMLAVRVSMRGGDGGIDDELV